MRFHPFRILATGLVAVSIISLFAGCMGYPVEVTSAAPPAGQAESPAPTSYVLRQTAAEKSPELLNSAAAGWLKNALALKGLHEAASAESAGMIVQYEYGEKEVERTIYVVVTNARAMDVLRAPRPAIGVVGPGSSPVGVLGGGGTISASQPPQGVPAFMTETEPRKKLRPARYLSLAATSPRTGQTLWQVTTISMRIEPPLRDTLPVLMAASVDYIGTSHRDPKRFDISSTADTVVAVRGPQ